MDNSLLDVRGINHKYIVVGGSHMKKVIVAILALAAGAAAVITAMKGHEEKCGY